MNQAERFYDVDEALARVRESSELLLRLVSKLDREPAEEVHHFAVSVRSAIEALGELESLLSEKSSASPAEEQS